MIYKTLTTILIISLIKVIHPVNEAEDKPLQGSVPILKFGVVADVQYCDCDPAGTRYYRSSLQKLREAVTSLKSDSVDFIVNLGDLIDRDMESYEPVIAILDSSKIKTYHVAGNHDFSVDQRFKRKLPVMAESREGYYSFKYSNFKFISLNGNEISTYGGTSRKAVADAEKMIASLKASGSQNAVEWNGATGPDQMTWLKKQLDESSLSGEKVIIFCHFPVFPDDVHNLLNSNEVITLLENYSNIIAWFAGHNHSGSYGNFNYIHCVTFKGMVETESTGSFSLVEIYHNKIWIKGSGRERSQILAY